MLSNANMHEVVMGEKQQRSVLFVDDFLYKTQVVTQMPGMAGGAIMGKGTAGLIPDVYGIISIAR